VAKTYVFKGSKNYEWMVRPMFEEHVGVGRRGRGAFFIAEAFDQLGGARLALEATKQNDLPPLITLSPNTTPPNTRE